MCRLPDDTLRLDIGGVLAFLVKNHKSLTAHGPKSLLRVGLGSFLNMIGTDKNNFC